MERAMDEVVRQRPPEPPLLPGPPVLGHWTRARTDPLGLFTQVANQLGDVGRFKVFSKQVVLLRDPAHVKHVLQDAVASYSKRTRGYAALRTVLGNGLVTSEGSFWLRQRRIAQPAFHRQRIAQFATTMAALTGQMLDRWEVLARSGAGVDAAEEMMGLTLRVVGRTLLSAEISDEAPTVRDALAELLRGVILRTTAPVQLPLWVPTARNRQVSGARAALDRIVLRIIQARRHGEHQEDLLSMLMEARDEETGDGMTDAQLRDEVMTLFLAGHETTANALAWTLYLLSLHADCRRRLEEEVDRVLGDRPPTLEDLPQLPYALQVLNESMRLYPPVWILMRRAEQDHEVGGYWIKAGTFVAVAPYVSHRNPRYFPAPEAFDPERFTPDREAALPRFAYFPFSGGPRVCIGKQFAQMEAHLVLAMIVQRFRLDLVPGARVEPEPTITLRPRSGVPLVLRPR